MSVGDDVPASRREVDILREEVHRMDDHGTRGVGALQLQVTDLVKDITELKTSTEKRFEKHEQEHAMEKRERTNARHWLIGTTITAMTVLVAMLALLLDILSKVHK